MQLVGASVTSIVNTVSVAFRVAMSLSKGELHERANHNSVIVAQREVS